MKRVICFLFLLMSSHPCLAKVVKAAKAPPKPLLKRLIIPVDNVTPTITQADVAKVIPLDFKQGESQSTVLTRIADRGFSLWFNSAAIKSSSLGRMAENAQEKLKTDVVVPANSDHSVSHKFSFRVEAFQALAKLEYTGWLNASVLYDAKAAASGVFFKDKVFSDKDLVVSHTANREQDLSMVALAWSW